MLGPESSWLPAEMFQELLHVYGKYVWAVGFASALYVFVGVPVCLGVLYVLAKDTRLRNHCNTALAVSIACTTFGAVNLAWMRVSVFPGLLPMSEETRSILWMLCWWAFSMSIRINSNR